MKNKKIKNRFTLFTLVAITMLNCSFASLKGQDMNNGTIKTVVIDAGHGGKDVGTHGAFSFEKDVTLEISLKVGKYIEENFPDIRVIYTRKTDIFITLKERAEIANKAHADLFICIHANSSSSSAKGTETWVMGLYKSKSNLEVAMRENASMLMEKDYKEEYNGFNPKSSESYIAMSLKQSAHLTKSLLFAKDVQEQFATKADRVDRGVKQAGFWVLYRTTMPSVLIETGFLTNENEEKYLNSKKGQDQLASSISNAFKEYKQTLESNSYVNQKEKDEQNKLATAAKNSSSNKEIKKKNKLNKHENLIFKIQIVTSSKKLKTTATNFKGLRNVDMYKLGNLYRYTYGEYKAFKEADDMKKDLRKKGFKDAFVVSFLEGKRITLKKALGMLK